MEVLSLDKVAPPRAKPVAPTTSSLDSLRFARDDPEPGATAKGRGPCRGVGVDDDFFDLGGDSLAAVRVVYEIDKTFHLKIPHKSLFQSSTIRTMGSVIAEHQKNNLDADNQKRISTKLLTLSRKEPATYTASPKRPFPFEDRQE
jgi:acyl carrier protein